MSIENEFWKRLPVPKSISGCFLLGIFFVSVAWIVIIISQTPSTEDRVKKLEEATKIITPITVAVGILQTLKQLEDSRKDKAHEYIKSAILDDLIVQRDKLRDIVKDFDNPHNKLNQQEASILINIFKIDAQKINEETIQTEYKNLIKKVSYRNQFIKQIDKTAIKNQLVETRKILHNILNDLDYVCLLVNYDYIDENLFRDTLEEPLFKIREWSDAYIVERRKTYPQSWREIDLTLTIWNRLPCEKVKKSICIEEFIQSKLKFSDPVERLAIIIAVSVIIIALLIVSDLENKNETIKSQIKDTIDKIMIGEGAKQDKLNLISGVVWQAFNNEKIKKEEKLYLLNYLYSIKLIGYKTMDISGDKCDQENTIDLRNVDMKGTNLSNKKFPCINLRGANLGKDNQNTLTNLSNTNFEKAQLIYVHFNGANLTDADFTDANLTGADFTDANLTGADFTDAKGITQEQIKSAKSCKEAKFDTEDLALFCQSR